MNVGFVSTRLAGTDGVSLETAKLATVLERMGHAIFYCAGELDAEGPPGSLVPEMHFAHPEAEWIHDAAFYAIDADPEELRRRIRAMARRLQDAIAAFVDRFAIDVLFPQNALAIPMQIPLGVALTDYVAATGITTLAHHHDFYWERPRFARSRVDDILDRAFPPDLPTLRHLVINSLARAALRERKGIDAVLLPNIFDFATPPPEVDAFAADLRAALGIPPEARLFLQPTRVVPRKGIEQAIELLHLLDDPRDVLLISHHAGDEGLAYMRELQALAEATGVELRYAAERFAPERYLPPNGAKVYSLWDAYPHADFVTYPSTIEGFGNAFLEAIYFYRPLMVNRYPVYAADLAPLGFRCVEIDGEVTGEAVAEARRLLADPALTREVTEHNFAVAREHFSYERAAAILESSL